MKLSYVLIWFFAAGALACDKGGNSPETVHLKDTADEVITTSSIVRDEADDEDESGLSAVNFTVERVRLTETVDNNYISYLPRVASSGRGKAGEVADKINTWLMGRYMINSFDQDSLEAFRWYDADFESSIEDSLLHIHFWGEYYGAYPNPVDESLYFSLNTGEPLSMPVLPFHKLFTPEGYTAFIRKFWLSEVRENFAEAIACADGEPYCSILDIATYSIENDKLTIALTDDCYPRVVQACAPDISLSLPADSVSAYLSSLGHKALLQDSVQRMSGAKRFAYLNDLLPRLNNNVFLYGKIGGDYPFTMAITLLDNGKAEGFYYYDKKLQPIQLKGQKKTDDTYRIDEYADTQRTGHFTIQYSKDYLSDAVYSVDYHQNMIYWKATWTNADSTKRFDVTLDAVKN